MTEHNAPPAASISRMLRDMNILYGVVGEGMGHATRSRVVIEHLRTKGHQVKVVVSGRAHGCIEAGLDPGAKGGRPPVRR